MPETPTIATDCTATDSDLLPDALKAFDRRTKQYKRAKGLADTFAEVRGGWAMISPMEREKIGLAAVSIVSTGLTLHRYLSGDAEVSATDYVRAVNTCSRAIAAMGRAPERRGPSLDEYLRQIAAKEAAGQ